MSINKSRHSTDHGLGDMSLLEDNGRYCCKAANSSLVATSTHELTILAGWSWSAESFRVASVSAFVAAADSAAALAHLEASLRFETDCSDEFAAFAQGKPGFALFDVRNPALYSQGHIPNAVNLPHGKIVASRLVDYPGNTLFVTCCAGPHCNGATRGAMCLAQLRRPVKLMIGGISGWLDEGFELSTPNAHAVSRQNLTLLPGVSLNNCC